ncbi:MAG TPA: TraC family protein [Candidatus Magasanikbacteria bacterium]|nr:TraC family protein [Candidatus Magasanikbacteria bacterium]
MKNEQSIKKKKSIPNSQAHVPISEVKNDTVVMKDGTLRAVLMVSSVNFGLLNEEEQQAIISSYVSFLNSLDHPLQICIQSRQLNIRPYMETLQARREQIENELLKAQISDYISFINETVTLRNITSKQFYVVVPYDPMTNKKKSFWSRLGDALNPINLIRLKEETFKKRKGELDARVRLIEAGLSGMNLDVIRLDTQALIELYYSTYNPDIAQNQPLAPVDYMRVES